MAHAPVALEEDSGEATTHDPPVDLSAVDRLLLIKALGRACGSLGSTDAELRRDLAAELSTEAVAARLNIQRLDELFTIEQAHTVFRAGQGYQDYILAPEPGVRALLAECFSTWQLPAHALVGAVHALLARAMLAAVAVRAAPRSPELAEEAERACLRFLGARRDATSAHISATLAAEARFPSSPAFTRLRAQLADVAGLVARAQREAAAIRRAGEDATLAVSAAGTPPPAPLPRKPSAVPLHSYYMGWLEKRSRHGRWQRRWVVVSSGLGRMWYMHKPGSNATRGVLGLLGATLAGGESVLADTDIASPTVFVVLAGGLAAGSERPRLVLRAESPSARNKWVEAVWAAIEGPHGDAPGSKDAALALPRTLALESTEGAELGAPVGTGVDRKISTRVFDEAELRGGGAPAEEGAETPAHETEEGEGRGEPGSPGRTLSQQSHDEWAACPGAGQSAIAPEERAVLQAVLPVVRTYVHETCLHLASQVSKVVSSGMLTGLEDVEDVLLQLVAGADP